MTLDTSAIYICTDSTNGTVHVLSPRRLTSFTDIAHLKLDEPDPYGPQGTDRAQYDLLRLEMEETTFDL